MQEYESGCFLSEHSACRSRRRLLLGDRLCQTINRYVIGRCLRTLSKTKQIAAPYYFVSETEVIQTTKET